jgi:maleate isomerase
LKFGVIIPAPNTSVQPEFDNMRPPGVTNHVARIGVPNWSLRTDKEFAASISAIDADLYGSVDRVMACEPNHVLMAMSAPTFWNGLAGARDFLAGLEKRAGVGVTVGSFAAQAALGCYPGVKRIGIFTPYQPIGDDHVRRFFTDIGYEVASIIGLKRPTGTAIAESSEEQMRATVRDLLKEKIDAIVQVGTDLAFADLADEAERWFGLPVIPINAAIYWHGLRQCGIQDRIAGFGSLLAEH